MNLPDTRSRYKQSVFGNTKGASDTQEENPYWQAYLNEIDSRDVGGYDWAVNEAETFFNNLEAYANELNAAGLNPQELQSQYFNEEKSITEYTADELAKMTNTTKIAMAFAEGLFHWLESSRDALVVSLIEGMPEEEYDKIVVQVKNGTYKNFIMRNEETKGQE